MNSYSTTVMTVVEHCRVTPPPGITPEMSLPLTFFDLPWISFPPLQLLFFYEYSHSNHHFIQTIIPSLKHSLSLTLKHFHAFAGNLTFPDQENSSIPKIRYVDGDSVSLIFAESSQDFNNLVGDHARNASEFYSLVPQLPLESTSSNTIEVPLLAVQVTLFSKSGISVGFTIHHAVADGSTCANFIGSWATINQSRGDAMWLEGRSLPCYDRAVVRDPCGFHKILWEQVREMKHEGCQLSQLPQFCTKEQVRATFVMGQANAQRLKKMVLTRCVPTLVHVSTFTVTCAYAWTCMVKARAESGENVGEDETEYFVFGADCRALLDPPLPATYFGNCVVPCLARVKSSQLMGEDGFFIAAKFIGTAIRERISNEDGVLKGAENWISDMKALKQGRAVGVVGSPKFRAYDADFGWGRPKKNEFVSIDVTGSISLTECRDAEMGLEIGLSFPKAKMEAFSFIFANNLKSLE